MQDASLWACQFLYKPLTGPLLITKIMINKRRNMGLGETRVKHLFSANSYVTI